MWEPAETYIFAILGSEPKECVERKKIRHFEKMENTDIFIEDHTDISFETPKTCGSSRIGIDKQDNECFKGIKTYKYINYYMTSHGILLKRLAKYYGIPDENIVIMAKGNKENFNTLEIKETKGKLYLQLSKTEIYETEIHEDEIDFEFFDKDDVEIINKLTSRIHFKKNAHIVLFLDDHGTHNEFADIPSLYLYIPFYQIQHSSLRIFNDSCHSETMIEIINRFFLINDIIRKRTNGKGIKIQNIKIIAKIASRFDKNKQLSSIQGEIAKIESIYTKAVPSLPSVDEKLSFIKSFVRKCKRKINKDNKEGFSSEYKNEVFSQLGLSTFADLFIFDIIFDLIDIENNDLLSIVNEGNYRIALDIYTNLGCKTSDDLYAAISDIQNQDIEGIVYKFFGQYLISPHDDHMIVTTAPSNGVAVTFGTRRINGTDVKIIMGSPGFGSFIDEVFFNVTPKPISVENIRSYAVKGKQTDKEKNDSSIDDKRSIEYASVSRKPKGEHGTKKQWIRLDINDFTTKNISSGRFFNAEILERHPERKDIMKSIGFKLVQEFQSDGETPVDESNDLFVEAKPRRRIRYSEKEFDPKEMTKDKSYVERGSFSIKYSSEEDTYYSDSEIHDNASYLRSSSASTSVSASEDEGGSSEVTELTEKEADKIIVKLKIPNYGWCADIYDFIVEALRKKTKKMKFPFDPEKEEGFNGINFNWARNCLRGYFPICEIDEATKLILLISDFAFQNGLECISHSDPVSRLIQSICKLGSERVPRFRSPAAKV